MIVALLVGGEIAFWVLVAAGLLARYGLRRPRVGAVLLWGTVAVDLVLLVATVIDLRNGATANFAHGLAAVYIGFSVAFGHSMIRWADQRVAYWFYGGPPPVKPPKRGPARTRYEWREFGKAVIAWAVTCALLGAAIWYVGDPTRSAALYGWIGNVTKVLVIWAIFPVVQTLWPGRPEPADEPATAPTER